MGEELLWAYGRIAGLGNLLAFPRLGEVLSLSIEPRFQGSRGATHLALVLCTGAAMKCVYVRLRS